MLKTPARIVCLGVLFAAAMAAPTRALTPTVEPVNARVIVTYKAGAALARDHAVARGASRRVVADAYQRRADGLARGAGVPLRAGRAVGEHAHVLTASGMDSATLVRRLQADPNVAEVAIDRRQRALLVPNDPLYAAGPASGRGPDVGQWYLRAAGDLFRSATNVEAAWDVSTGTGIVVAVLDTGMLFDHLDFDSRLLAGYDMISDAAYANDVEPIGGERDADAADPGDWITAGENSGSGPLRNCGVEDSSWHGTKVAGIIGAATGNGLGMAGIAHGARILPVRVLGKCGGFESDIAAGMRWAAGIDQPGLLGAATPAKVLNLSLGGDGACSTTYRDAVTEVIARGAVIVAAAGNTTGRAVSSPANCPGVIGVAGLRHAGSKVGFSDLGPEISIAAPGGNCINITAGTPCLYPILTASNSGTRGPNAGGSIFTDSFDISVGTSFATPIVAGAAALVLAARPQLTPAEVKQILQSSARAFPASGADNGPDDPTPVTACRAPDSTNQLQCYCPNVAVGVPGLCGAGMLDAAGAVAAATGGLFARIEATPASPQAGAAVTLSGSSSLVGNGRVVRTWAWSLVNGGGVVSGFSGATDAASASLQPTAAGTVVVRLNVTDDLGATSSADRSIAVAAAPVVPPVTPPATGGGGGGAASWAWLLALLAAVQSLRQRHPGRGCKAE